MALKRHKNERTHTQKTSQQNHLELLHHQQKERRRSLNDYLCTIKPNANKQVLTSNHTLL